MANQKPTRDLELEDARIQADRFCNLHSYRHVHINTVQRTTPTILAYFEIDVTDHDAADQLLDHIDNILDQRAS